MSLHGASEHTPLVVHGSTASYYTGKLEAILRAKGIPYHLEPFSRPGMRRCAAHTGVVQIPQVECPDGSWLVDTTLILEYAEREVPEPALSPRAPAVAFVSALVEDFGDEWLWRPAMHYRWSYPETARVMSGWLAEHLHDAPGPQWAKRRFWITRQRRIFVAGDGVTRETRAAVERSYLDTIDALEPALQRRPFVLGERPTEADFGLFASMFRHFGCDPAPARIMRERAPGVYEWVAHVWNLRPERFADRPLPETIPDDLAPLLALVAAEHLPHLEAHAAAHARGERRVSYEVRGTRFTEPVKPYRAWCRDRLQQRLVALEPDARAEVERALGAPEALAALERPSPKAAEPAVASLPIRTRARRRPVDSWWRA